MLRKICASLVAVAAIGASATAAQAGNIWGMTHGYPDVNTSGVTVSYSVSSGVGTLVATFGSTYGLTYKPTGSLGSWTTYMNGSGPGATFQLTAVINATNGAPITGSGSSADNLLIKSGTSTTYATASGMNALADFQLVPGTKELGFVFTEGSGGTPGFALAPTGKAVILQLNLSSVIQGGSSVASPSLLSAFTGSAGTQDAFAVPMPKAADIGLMGLGLVGGMAYLRKRRAHRNVES